MTLAGRGHEGKETTSADGRQATVVLVLFSRADIVAPLRANLMRPLDPHVMPVNPRSYFSAFCIGGLRGRERAILNFWGC